MPRRNSLKTFHESGFYHIYNRGVNKNPIFFDKRDFDFFMNLLNRYLSIIPVQRKHGPPYPTFHDKIKVHAFCLMDNHFHILLSCTKDAKDITKFIHCLETSYSSNINFTYKRIGHLFQGVYRSVEITDESQYSHISRYIHTNPGVLNDKFLKYKYSSMQDYVGDPRYHWLYRDEFLQGMKPLEYIKFCKIIKLRDIEEFNYF